VRKGEVKNFKMTAPAGASTDCGRPNSYVGGTPLPKRNFDDGLHDSGFISPPTLVKFEADTPCHYFLRGQAKWSSTPLPLPDSCITPLTKSSSSPTITTTTSTPSNFVTNFQKRLDNCENGFHDFDGGFQDPDSGFESLINSTAETECSEGECSSEYVELRDDAKNKYCGHNGAVSRKGEDERIETLGAIPKRRSPRQVALASKVDGIERLARIKSGKRNLNVVEKEPEREDTKFSVPDFEKYTTKKNLLRQPCLISKEGRETCDFLRHFYEKNISGVLSHIFTYLSPEDLCRVAQVSQLWNLALNYVKFHDERRANFVAIMRVNRENAGVSFVKLRSKLASPRRVMQEVANFQPLSPNSGKRDRNPSSSTIVSPSKIRHKLFVDEARKLNPGERLVHCPLCTSPSRVSLSAAQSSIPTMSSQNFQKARCSSPKCNFEFCPDCQCEHHEGRSCRVTRTGSSKVPRSGAVTSKKSKARLRRL